VIFYIKNFLANLSFWLASYVCKELNTVYHSVTRWTLNCKCSGTFSICSIFVFVIEDWVEGIDYSTFIDKSALAFLIGKCFFHTLCESYCFTPPLKDKPAIPGLLFQVSLSV
jgi:hypothetical protein